MKESTALFLTDILLTTCVTLDHLTERSLCLFIFKMGIKAISQSCYEAQIR